MATIKSSGADNLRQDQNTQILLYTNSKTNAEGSLMNTANALLEKNKKSGGPLTIARLMSGGDGIKSKTPVIDSFTFYGRLPESASI